MRSVLFGAGCLLLLSTFVVSAQTSKRAQPDDDQAYLQWLSKSLMFIQTIKVGMTRRDLLTHFTEDGGIQQVGSERYVYKQCPIIKVDVTFAPSAGDHSNDRIKSISKAVS